MNNCTRLFSQNISGIITRSTTNFKKHAPRSKNTKCILTNGATISYWTSLPMAKIWRADSDIISNPPDYVMDNIEKIKEKRRKELEDKFSQFKR
ncbi:hypothetical protein RB653_002351 [Dictyostelium firmibasis]|uniref:Uncharacterized protein n=1 Tax=Dictyostelium firmibasis TaxID=79012 RepID=A0AAN7U2U4_9MYCE